MKYVIFHQSLQESSFLLGQFHKKELLKLVISHFTYETILLQKLEVFNNFKFIITQRPIITCLDIYETLTENKVPVDSLDLDNQAVYCYDIVNFPLAAKELNNILGKFAYIDEPSCCYYYDSRGNKHFTGIAKLGLKAILERKDSGWPLQGLMEGKVQVDVTSYISRLDSPRAIIELFAANFNLRHFNSLEKCKYFFKKVSADKRKMQVEHSFLTRIPIILRPFFPHVGNFFDEGSVSKYEIEKIYFFDASKLLINGVFKEETIIDNFINSIKEYLDLCPRKKVSSEEYRNSLKSSFLDKNVSRFKMLNDCPNFAKLNSLCKLITGVELSEYYQQMNLHLEKTIDSDQLNELCFSHGDLCLSNILYNPETNQLKLIDPRGSESESGDYMPIYYDVAKLCHSFIGLYDLILNELYEINFNHHLKLTINHLLDQQVILNMEKYFAHFIGKLNLDIRKIRLFESSLFLSMMPLHKENEKRMLAQLIQSYRSFQEYLK